MDAGATFVEEYGLRPSVARSADLGNLSEGCDASKICDGAALANRGSRGLGTGNAASGGVSVQDPTRLPPLGTGRPTGAGALPGRP